MSLPFRIAPILLAALASAACGAPPGQEAEDATRSAVDAPADPPRGETAGEAADDSTDGPTDGPGETGAGPGEAEPSPDGPALPDWTIDEAVVEGGGHAEVTALRVGRNDGFDRVVLDLTGGMPRAVARYVDRPLHACGSGQEIHPVGDAWLELHLEGAQGHSDEGRAWLQREMDAPEAPAIQRIYRTCDFEGYVTLVLAVPSPNAFRLFSLREPQRLVLDVRQGR